MDGINYKEGWVTMTATNIKVFIDVFIGIWAFLLAAIWCTMIECKPGQRRSSAPSWTASPAS